MKTLTAADLFCGAGGTSTGMMNAAARLGYTVHLTGINHWNVAVATHTRNHPYARHMCASLDALNPRDLYPDGKLDLLWASPECINHSTARGGRPINDQSRATAWCVARWAEALTPPVILVENVPAFLQWGPLGSDLKPLKSRKGEVFNAWVGTLRALGYKVEWKILVAADYGDPTSRKRLFIQAVRGRRQITWPEPTHSIDGKSLPKWRSARSIIDWEDQGVSVFGRSRPLADGTMRRILIGLRKYGVASLGKDAPELEIPDHLVHLRGTATANDVNRPVPAITAGGNHYGVAQPSLIPIQPFMLSQQSGGAPRSTEDPVSTVTTGGAISLVQPFLVEVNHGGERRPRNIEEPLPTITCGHANGDGRNLAVCQPMLLEDGARPAPAAATDPYLVQCDNGSQRSGCRSADQPVGTVVTKQNWAVVQPYLIEYNGTSDALNIDRPMPAISTHERHGVCLPTLTWNGRRYQVDIKFRMLSPRELARAQGFPEDYEFHGRDQADVVRQIGNAVPVGLSSAIVHAVLQANPI